jgi:hypothetical protein
MGGIAEVEKFQIKPLSCGISGTFLDIHNWLARSSYRIVLQRNEKCQYQIFSP